MLTKAQKLMIFEIAEAERGVLYVRDYTQPARTANALRVRKLIEVVEPDHSSLRMQGYGLTEKGQQVAHELHWPETLDTAATTTAQADER